MTRRIQLTGRTAREEPEANLAPRPACVRCGEQKPGSGYVGFTEGEWGPWLGWVCDGCLTENQRALWCVEKALRDQK